MRDRENRYIEKERGAGVSALVVQKSEWNIDV